MAVISKLHNQVLASYTSSAVAEPSAVSTSVAASFVEVQLGANSQIKPLLPPSPTKNTMLTNSTGHLSKIAEAIDTTTNESSEWHIIHVIIALHILLFIAWEDQVMRF
ncbi:hypothetical protein BSLG_003177 [Batrachochytrium salamandrivorans]|nr:hypothetical protein BSLG_003177 [Batrachochytrium salamandrivorans]